jgi:hypothetical protein
LHPSDLVTFVLDRKVCEERSVVLPSTRSGLQAHPDTHAISNRPMCSYDFKYATARETLPALKFPLPSPCGFNW